MSDCQTANFHTRLWEAQLLASFREQGLLVTQPHELPDFLIENRLGGEAWVEAVTANPPVAYNHVNAPAQRRAECARGTVLRSGGAAVRQDPGEQTWLASTTGSCRTSTGKPFMIAIADFQAPASMMWSREGLIGYLYGQGAEVAEVNGPPPGGADAPRLELLGSISISRRSVREMIGTRELSAVIFSNACSIAKLNRVAVSGGGAPKGLRYTRIGKLLRPPRRARSKGIPFCLDVTSDDYRGLWPQGYEPWSAELEVFHNPYARCPAPFELLARGDALVRARRGAGLPKHLRDFYSVVANLDPG